MTGQKHIVSTLFTTVSLMLIGTLLSSCAAFSPPLSEQSVLQTAEVMFAMETGEAAPTYFAQQTKSAEETANAPTLTPTFTATFTITPTFTASPSPTYTFTPSLTPTPTKALGCFYFLDSSCIGDNSCALFELRNPTTKARSASFESLKTGSRLSFIVPAGTICRVALESDSTVTLTTENCAGQLNARNQHVARSTSFKWGCGD